MVLTFLILTNSDRIQPGSPQLVLRPSYTTIATRYYLYLAKQSNSATEFYIQYPPVLSSSIPNEKNILILHTSERQNKFHLLSQQMSRFIQYLVY